MLLHYHHMVIMNEGGGLDMPQHACTLNDKPQEGTTGKDGLRKM